jgi:hypothetical protein
LPAGLSIADLAGGGLAALAAARAERGRVPPGAAPALLAGWLADLRLRRAAADAEAVWHGDLEVSPFRARAALLLRATSGRW